METDIFNALTLFTNLQLSMKASGLGLLPKNVCSSNTTPVRRVKSFSMSPSAIPHKPI